MSVPTKSLQMGLAEATHPQTTTELAVAVSGLTEPMALVLKRTVCAKLTDDQFLLYLAICAKKEVDPFTGAYAFPNSEGGLAFGLRIDGMRALAMRTGALLNRTVEDITDPKDSSKVIGARATIERLGMTKPVVEDAYFSEYDRGGMGWKQFPITMIRKVAEAKCLRAAFPDALSGSYEPSEVDHANEG
jgi:RecT family